MEYLRCHVAQRTVAVHVDDVREIVSDPPMVAPMFGSPGMIGLMQAHGTVVPVVSLDTARSRFPYVVIVDAGEGDLMGFGVDRCGGMISRPEPSPEDGSVEMDGERVELIVPQALIGTRRNLS